MKKTIKVESGKTVELAANAATPFRFKQLFDMDLLKIFQKGATNEEDQMLLADVVSQLAFIMNQQALKADMNNLSLSDFYSWLEDFEAMDFIVSCQDVIDVYLANTKTTIEAKKK